MGLFSKILKAAVPAAIGFATGGPAGAAMGAAGSLSGGGGGSILSAGGNILGALGEGKGHGPTQVSGFASLPPDVQAYMLQKILPLIQGYGSKPYQGIPRRRLNASDTDPTFGSRARPEIQQYLDARAAAGAGGITSFPRMG